MLLQSKGSKRNGFTYHSVLDCESHMNLEICKNNYGNPDNSYKKYLKK